MDHLQGGLYQNMLRAQLNTITGTLKHDVLRVELFQHEIITPAEKDTFVTGENKSKSDTEKCTQLLQLVFSKDNQKQVKFVHDVLGKSSNENHRKVAHMVKEEFGKMTNGQHQYDVTGMCCYNRGGFREGLARA